MTISSTTNKVTLEGNGTTTRFPFSFRLMQADDMQVWLTNTFGDEYQITSNYRIIPTGGTYPCDSGEVEYPGWEEGTEPAEELRPPTLPDDWKITLLRDLSLVQNTTYPAAGSGVNPKTVEKDFDRVVMMIQSLSERIGRQISAGVSAAVGWILPAPVANALIGWKADGQGLENKTMTPETVWPVATVQAAIDHSTGTGSPHTAAGVGALPADTTPADIGAATAGHDHSGVYEPVLGNPASNGYVLSSTTAGVRSWIAAAASTSGVIGETGKTYRMVACVLQNTGSGWACINDSTHTPIGVTSITAYSDNIRVTYSFTAAKVISFLAVPDETWGPLGYTFGASVGTTYAGIMIGRNYHVGGHIYYSGSAWVKDNCEGIGTLSYSVDILTIPHNDVGIGGPPSTTPYRSSCHTTIYDASSATQTQVLFKDYAGNTKGSADTSMNFYFNRRSPATVDPTTLTSALGNIWVFGIFEI